MKKNTVDICNVWKSECFLRLPASYSICSLCNGHGGEVASLHPKRRQITVLRCPKCLGEGKVDWISATREKLYTPRVIKVQIRKFHCKVNKKCKKQRKSCKGQKHVYDSFGLSIYEEI